MMKRFTLTLLCLMAGVSFAVAQGNPIELVNSYPAPLRNMIAFNGKVFFGAGNELWMSDGTNQGTVQIKDFGVSTTAFPYCFKVFSNKLYFIATDSLHGSELWSTDGTTAGTQMVKDINPYDIKSAFKPRTFIYYPKLLQELNGKLYFFADDSVHGKELWVSDGTATGTQMVKDIYAQADSNGIAEKYDYDNEDMLAAGGKLYFPANDGGGAGVELWSSDGTTAGTQLVRDLFPGATGSYPRDFIPFLNKVVFTSDMDTTYLNSIHISDGTYAGTIEIGGGYLNTGDNVIFNNKLYFFAKEYNSSTFHFCVSDGTEPGTIALVPFPNTISYPTVDYGIGRQALTVFNNKMYFRQIDVPGVGVELWQSDGTVAGTTLLKDIHSGPMGTYPHSFTEFGGMLYFRTNDSVWNKLYYTDGTAAGTQELIVSGADFYSVAILARRIYEGQPLVVIGSTMYFANPFFTSDGPRVYRLGMFPENVTGVPQISSIDVFPNPTQGYINVDAENATNVTVQDISGRSVYTSGVSAADKMHKIDVVDLPAGTYTITTLLSDGSKRYGKFVKQ